MPTPSPDALSFTLTLDHADLLSALNAHGARYLVVGGHAVGAHAEPRATKDLDIFILCNEENSLAVYKALAAFGAPLAGFTPDDFNDRHSYFQIGEPPLRVDILQILSAVSFDEAWESRIIGRVNDHLEVPVISADLLIKNKRAAGRPQDLADAFTIERRRALLKRYYPDEDLEL